MGIFDKLKNVFFEEEYVEEEVQEPKSKKEKSPVAKKIDLPETNKTKEEPKQDDIIVKKEIEDPVIVETNEENEELKRENYFRFPMDFEDDDFRQDTLTEIPIVSETGTRHRVDATPKIEAEEVYHNPYPERKEQRKEESTFKASPIISPIFGVLDKNYRKEEVVTKKEIRLSASASSRNYDVDSIREKAYGDLASEITASIMDEEDEDIVSNTLYDLNEEDSPKVATVTVGDAEEYFDELGLEYNIDYEDTSTKQKTGRRSNRKTIIEEEEEPDNEYPEEDEISDDIIEETVPKDDDVVEDNLFDLIDSMYEDKE